MDRMPRIVCCAKTRVVWMTDEEDGMYRYARRLRDPDTTMYAVCTCGREFWFAEPPWKRLRSDRDAQP